MTAPLVPADIDVDRLAGFLLDVDRLLSSELMALSTGEEFKAAVTLWARAWKQRPAGSLPDDDRLLAAFSGAGPRWNKVKAMALRGFVKCSDGRLYHRVLCEDVLRAADAKRRRRERTIAASEARKGQAGAKRDDRRNDDRNDNRDGDRNDPKPPDRNDNVTRSHRLDGTGQEEKERAERARGTRLAADWVLPPEWRTAAEQARREAVLPPCNIDLEAASFRDFWIAKPGAGGVKLDWRATWLNWARRANSRPAQGALPMNGGHAAPAQLTKSGAPPSKNIRVGSAEDIAERLAMGIITEEMAAEERARLPR